MKGKDNILVVIAARGGSKGLKNKNIRTLIDRPLIAYTVQQAMAWGKGTNVICSTDSRKVAEIAKKYGADVPFMRPKSLARDNTAKIAVLRHALVTCESLYDKVYDIIVDLDVTAPIREVFDLDHCLKIFKEKRPKTLFSVINSRKNPYFNMVEGKRGKITLSKMPDKPVFARQNAPSVYDLNASIYFYRRDYLINKKNSMVVSDDSCIYIMDKITGVDIDDEIDFKFVEFLFKERIWKSEV